MTGHDPGRDRACSGMMHWPAWACWGRTEGVPRACSLGRVNVHFPGVLLTPPGCRSVPPNLSPRVYTHPAGGPGVW